MSTDTAKLFFSVLSLFAWAGTLTALGLAWAHRRNPDSSAGLLYEDIARNAIWLAFVIAVVTTLGSLYLSEVMHFEPCPLCWYQRICMYPLTVALFIGARRGDRQVWRYVLPPALIGAAISIYHSQLQAFPKQPGRFCTAAELCKVRYIYEFHFVSIPLMALSAFTFIIVMMLFMRAYGDIDYEDEDEDETASADANDARKPSTQGVA